MRVEGLGFRVEGSDVGACSIVWGHPGQSTGIASGKTSLDDAGLLASWMFRSHASQPTQTTTILNTKP